MRYRYRHFIEREFVATRRWLGLSLVRWSGWWRRELEHLERYLSQRGEWYAVAFAGFLGVFLTFMLLASYREPTLYNVNIELPPVAARLPRIPELPVADVDTRISLAPQLLVADYPAEFMFVGLERRVVDPYLSRSTFTVPADLSLSVDWLHSVVPEAALAAMDASRNEATASSDSGQSSRAWSDILNRIRDDWRLAQSRPNDSQMAAYSLATPYTGLGNRLPKALADELTSDVPKSTVSARGEAYFEVAMESSRRSDLQQGGESIVSIRNLSSETLPLVEVLEPFSRMPQVVGAFPDGYVDQDGLKRSISLLPPGESERLTTRWLSSRQTANDLLSTNLGRFPAGATSSEYRLQSGNPSLVQTVAEVTADAVAGSRTLVTPPRKNARLAIQLSSTDRIVKGKNLKMNIRVQNIGEIPLDNVRILADLSPELTHYYGNAVEYEVGSLRLNEDHQTIFIIEGKTLGAGKAVLRAVSPDTPIAMEVSQLLVTDDTGYSPVAVPARNTPRDQPSDFPLPRPGRSENSSSDPRVPSMPRDELLPPRERIPAARPQNPIPDDGLFGPAPGELPANPRPNSSSDLNNSVRNSNQPLPRVPDNMRERPDSGLPLGSPPVDDPLNRSDRTGRELDRVLDPNPGRDLNLRDRGNNTPSADPFGPEPQSLDSTNSLPARRPSLPAVNEPAFEPRQTQPVMPDDNTFGPAPGRRPLLDREASPSTTDMPRENSRDFPPLPDDFGPVPTDLPSSGLPSRTMPLERDRLDNLTEPLEPARPRNSTTRPSSDPLDNAFPDPLPGQPLPSSTTREPGRPADPRQPLPLLPEMTPRNRDVPARDPLRSPEINQTLDDRIDKTIPNRSGWNPTLPGKPNPSIPNDPLDPFPELNEPVPSRMNRDLPRLPDALDTAAPDTDAANPEGSIRSRSPQPASEPDPFSNGFDPLDLLEKADPATNQPDPLRQPESPAGRRTLPALPTEIPDDFPPLGPLPGAGQPDSSTRNRESPTGRPTPATQPPLPERNRTSPQDPFDPFPANDGVIRKVRPAAPEMPVQPVAQGAPSAPFKVVTASYQEFVPVRTSKTPVKSSPSASVQSGAPSANNISRAVSPEQRPDTSK